jgi:mono/diheme cytochrome c family protein
MNPPLTGTSFVTGDKATLIKIVLDGMANVPVDGEEYRNVMPGFEFLSDEEIGDLLTYIRNSFGNEADRITAAEVAETRTTRK